jgi:U3 small nucleolar RNA-associated protein 12
VTNMLCQILVGTKEGNLELYDIGSSALVHKVEAAHGGPIWSLQVHPSGKQVITGSSDKAVKMWDFVVKETADLQKTITLKHVRTLKMTDDILSIRISPDSRLLAVATLDFTVKVFYLDTLKFFLSLYGHKVRR